MFRMSALNLYMYSQEFCSFFWNSEFSEAPWVWITQNYQRNFSFFYLKMLIKKGGYDWPPTRLGIHHSPIHQCWCNLIYYSILFYFIFYLNLASCKFSKLSSILLRNHFFYKIRPSTFLFNPVRWYAMIPQGLAQNSPLPRCRNVSPLQSCNIDLEIHF